MATITSTAAETSSVHGCGAALRQAWRKRCSGAVGRDGRGLAYNPAATPPRLRAAPATSHRSLRCLLKKLAPQVGSRRARRALPDRRRGGQMPLQGAYLFADPPSYLEACAAPAPAPRPLVVWTQHYAAGRAAGAAALADADAADGSDGGYWARLCRWRRPRPTAVTWSGCACAPIPPKRAMLVPTGPSGSGRVGAPIARPSSGSRPVGPPDARRGGLGIGQSSCSSGCSPVFPGPPSPRRSLLRRGRLPASARRPCPALFRAGTTRVACCRTERGRVVVPARCAQSRRCAGSARHPGPAANPSRADHPFAADIREARVCSMLDGSAPPSGRAPLFAQILRHPEELEVGVTFLGNRCCTARSRRTAPSG